MKGKVITADIVETIPENVNNASLSTLVLNSRDRQGMYGMQHFRTPRNPPYKRL